MIENKIVLIRKRGIRNQYETNADSMLSVMTAAIEQDHRVRITAERPDEDDAIRALGKLIEQNFPAGKG